MTMHKSLQSLVRLVDLRETEVHRLTAQMNSRRLLRDRYRGNLERLQNLYESTGASGALPPALSLNCAAYKQAVMQLADEHRLDLALHEADMAVAQLALTTASRQHAVLGQALEQKQQSARKEQRSREQKRQDELASQAWWRGRM